MAMHGGFSPYELLSQMRLSNYMSSPAFDRGMSQGPMQGGGGGFGMSSPFMPSQADVDTVAGGGMPAFQPMPHDNPLGLYAGQMNGRAVNSGPFGMHPAIQNAIGNALNFAGNFQQGETVGENIGGVARGLMGNFMFPRQAAMGRFEGAFNVGNQLQELQQRKAMTDYYSGRGDYYQMKNEYEQKFHDQADATKRAIDDNNNKTKADIENVKANAQAQHERDWLQIMGTQNEIRRISAEAAAANSGLTLQKDYAKNLDLASKFPAGTPQGDKARSWLSAYTSSQHGLAEAKDAPKRKDADMKRGDDFKNRQLITTEKQKEDFAHNFVLKGGKMKDIDSQIQAHNQYINQVHEEWKKNYNEKDPYDFSSYLSDKQRATGREYDPPQTSGAGSPIPSATSVTMTNTVQHEPNRPSNVPPNYVFDANGPKGRGWYKP